MRRLNRHLPNMRSAHLSNRSTMRREGSIATSNSGSELMCSGWFISVHVASLAKASKVKAVTTRPLTWKVLLFEADEVRCVRPHPRHLEVTVGCLQLAPHVAGCVPTCISWRSKRNSYAVTYRKGPSLKLSSANLKWKEVAPLLLWIWSHNFA
jgi:hypothetical protein